MLRAQRVVIQLSLPMKLMVFMLDDETSFDDNIPSTSECVEAATTQIISYGPHCKLSRGDDIYSLKDEYEMVQDTKFVCTLSLLLVVFKSRCQTPECTAIPNVRYHFVGMTLFISSYVRQDIRTSLVHQMRSITFMSSIYRLPLQ